MLKLTFCLRRLPSLTLAQFQAYWLNTHGPLVRRLQPALRMARYVQLHRLDGDLATGMVRVRGAPEPFDGLEPVDAERVDGEGVGATGEQGVGHLGGEHPQQADGVEEAPRAGVAALDDVEQEGCVLG